MTQQKTLKSYKLITDLAWGISQMFLDHGGSGLVKFLITLIVSVLLLVLLGSCVVQPVTHKTTKGTIQASQQKVRDSKSDTD